MINDVFGGERGERRGFFVVSVYVFVFVFVVRVVYSYRWRYFFRRSRGFVLVVLVVREVRRRRVVYYRC